MNLLLCVTWIKYYVIGIFSKYAWGVSLKDNTGITITNAFQKIFDG